MNAEVQTVVVKTDTSNIDDVQKMVDEGVKAFGAIHYCVNCAGITSRPRLRSHELPIEAWDRVLGINLRGVWLCQRAQIIQILKQEPQSQQQMRSGGAPERGSIVNISSVLGRTGNATSGAVSNEQSFEKHLGFEYADSDRCSTRPRNTECWASRGRMQRPMAGMVSESIRFAPESSTRHVSAAIETLLDTAHVCH